MGLLPLDKIPDKLWHFGSSDVEVLRWGFVVLGFLPKGQGHFDNEAGDAFE